MLGLFTFVLTVFSAAALVSLLALHGNARKLFCGLGATIFSIIMYASPLSIMRLVIKTKSVEFMPFFLSLFVFLCGTSWFVFGLLGRDAFIAVTCFADPKWFWVWAGVDAAHPLLHLSQEQRIPVPLPTKLLRWNMRNMQMEKMNMFNWGVKMSSEEEFPRVAAENGKANTDAKTTNQRQSKEALFRCFHRWWL